MKNSSNAALRRPAFAAAMSTGKCIFSIWVLRSNKRYFCRIVSGTSVGIVPLTSDQAISIKCRIVLAAICLVAG